MGGLSRVLKQCGEMTVKDRRGKTVTYIWDYAENRARKKSEMTNAEIAASDKAKRS